MAQTLFTDLVTLIASSWLNDVDAGTYNTLSAVAGTNTITATGPSTVTSYAANQWFKFTPAATNTGATTINISNIGAKNIFSNGAACVGGELKISVPTIIFYDGTQFNILASRPPKFKVITFTRDTSLATGTQAVTGVGFQPRALIFTGGTTSGNAQSSIVGFDDGTTHGGTFDNSNNTADTLGTSATKSITFTQSGSAVYEGIVSSLDSDGFTISWTKTGTTSGTNTVVALCFS